MVKLKFGDVPFCGSGKLENPEKIPRSKVTTNNEFNPPRASARIGGNWVTDWREANAPTTKLYLLIHRGFFISSY